MIRRTLLLMIFLLLLAPGCGGGDGMITPTLTGVSPGIGLPSGGETLTLTGTNFALFSAVTVGGAPCTAVSIDGSGTSLTCTSPSGTAGTSNDVTISTGTGSATLTRGFTYVASPKPTPRRLAVVDVVLEDADGLRVAKWSDVLDSAASGQWGRSVEQHAGDLVGASQVAEAAGFLFVLDLDLGVLGWYADPAAFWLGELPDGCMFDEGFCADRALQVVAR